MIDPKSSTPARKAPAPPTPAAEGGSAADRQEVTLTIPAAVAAQPSVEAAPGAEETFVLPDRVGAAVATSEDAVAARLGKGHSISRGGAAPSGYGVTRSNVSVTGTKVTHRTAPTPVFQVKAKLTNTITWQVRTGAGPGGRTHIGSEKDPALTAANYVTAASDLTPDMSDLNGRPPRSAFWARDLTERHEKYHTGDHKTEGRACTDKVQTWLNTKTAASKTDVDALMAGVPGRWNSYFFTTMSRTTFEERAYGDGAPSYKRRAKAIKKRGDAGKYP